MAVITISRQFGAGGMSLGEILAKRLGYRYVNQAIIKEVAKKAKVSSDQVRAFEKAGTTKLMKMLDKFVSRDFIDRLVSDKYGYVDEKSYVDVVKAIVKGLYKEGNVIIIGRGSQYILKGCEDAWHILLVEELKGRIRFITERYGLTEEEAEKAIRRADQIRTSFLSCFADKASHDDPQSYDLVINMNRLSLEKAEELVMTLIS
jgi:cytidylate kinase